MSSTISSSPPTLVSSTKCWNGFVKKYKHQSASTKTQMTFTIYLPPQAETGSVSTLYWLSGLTCSDDNFTQKAGSFRAASYLGVAIVVPDTSPRGAGLPGEKDSYDLGEGAGFYVNATEPPWSQHYRMYDYITQELPALIEANFPVTNLKSISGHSMGGHGALICWLKNPGKYRSCSAFAPIAHPSKCPWGIKAFTAYLGPDQDSWKVWDATELILKYDGPKIPILIEQGDADSNLKEQLRAEEFIFNADRAGIPITYRLREGYDHSYFFIQTFIDSHIDYAAKALEKEIDEPIAEKEQFLGEELVEK